MIRLDKNERKLLLLAQQNNNQIVLSTKQNSSEIINVKIGKKKMSPEFCHTAEKMRKKNLLTLTYEEKSEGFIEGVYSFTIIGREKSKLLKVSKDVKIE